MKLEEFIPNKFYHLNKMYFKFKKFEHDYVYNYGYQIIEYDGKLTYRKYNTARLMPIETFPFCDCSEIDISYIIDCLPDNDIDKKYFLRKQKITNLLKC